MMELEKTRVTPSIIEQTIMLYYNIFILTDKLYATVGLIHAGHINFDTSANYHHLDVNSAKCIMHVNMHLYPHK